MSPAICRFMVVGVFALSLSACSEGPSEENTPPTLGAEVDNACAVASSSNWQAWLNRMPGPDEPKLHVSGDIELAEPGLTASFSLGPLDRRRPPSQRILMTVQKSDGVADVRKNISAAFPALAESYRSIVIVCGNDEVATITEIEVAQ